MLAESEKSVLHTNFVHTRPQRHEIYFNYILEAAQTIANHRRRRRRHDSVHARL